MYHNIECAFEYTIYAAAFVQVLYIFGMTFFRAAWISELISSMRPQLLILSALTATISITIKRDIIEILLFALTVIQLYQLNLRFRLAKKLPPASVSEQANTISIVMSNVLYKNTNYSDVISLVRSENPDIFIAIETTTEWVDALQPLSEYYQFAFTAPQFGFWGISIFSKTQFAHDLFVLGTRNMPLVRMEFDKLIVYVVHPLPPLSSEMNSEGRTYIDALVAKSSAEFKPVILIGDFNATVWSDYLTQFTGPNWRWPKNIGSVYTWPTTNPLMAMQIDLFITKGVSNGSLRALTSIGSDHYPIRADFNL
jgi:vancomycin resistance protein VanJ